MLGEFFFRTGCQLEFRAAHTNPENAQVPPPPPLPGKREAIDSKHLRYFCEAIRNEVNCQPSKMFTVKNAD